MTFKNEVTEELDKLKAENAALQKYLSFNAHAMAKQTDQARDAETETIRLKRVNKELLDELENIVKANWRQWYDGLNTPEQFVLWAQSRARTAIAKSTGTYAEAILKED